MREAQKFKYNSTFSEEKEKLSIRKDSFLSNSTYWKEKNN